MHYFTNYPFFFLISICLLKSQSFMHYLQHIYIFYRLLLLFFYILFLSWLLTGLWSGWWWGLWTSPSPSTGGRWCGSPPSATPSSPWVAASPTGFAASPPRACRYLYILIFLCLIHAVQFLGSYF